MRERTEGWPAGLRLAALSLRDQADRKAFVVAFAGDDRQIAEYLHEFVAAQPRRLREFLLRTSILGRLCASGPFTLGERAGWVVTAHPGRNEPGVSGPDLSPRGDAGKEAAMNAPTAGAGRPGGTTPGPGSGQPPGSPQGQREDPVTGEDRLHVVFGTGQVGSALAAHLADLGIPVRTVSKHRPATPPGGADWRAADVTDPEAAADVAKGATVIYQCLNAPCTQWPELFPPLQLVRFDWRIVPGGVIPEHIHPRQYEQFTILAGQTHFTLNGEKHVAGPGQTIVVPAGVPHSVATPGQPRSTPSSNVARRCKPRSSTKPSPAWPPTARPHLLAHRRTRSSSAPHSGTSATKAGSPQHPSGCRTSCSRRCGRWQRYSAYAPTTTAGIAESEQLAEATQTHPQPPTAAPKTGIAHHERPWPCILAAGPQNPIAIPPITEHRQ
jgi:hypothetical protein